ncbi:putative nucleotidyltransferase with HDIG domain [Roseimicrobium gellanilyticum]|uniref:Putative nucleotidyltransferase with HDIG domain n=1 Tax=Roseimicrobium gellanilyticum TaxID=748857 RepID=A0A366HI19_9BACT|nr:AAA family ATPase [Roseimicrobium gellanilyticum]RBP42396.1 putative nucleotidyltransferase with HDIG domain [Roseimicrobium gellanilyticum]
MRNWQDILKSTNAELLAWAGQTSWAHDMRSCQQDSEWHAEGDVWTHTTMVWHQVEMLDEYADLDRLSQLKLLFTALLHDAGKPATTARDPESGRLRSPKHSIVGASLARQVLREVGCPLELREEIAHLVRYHGRPPYLLEKSAPEHEVIRLSCLLRNRLLYLFALADTRGRDTREMSRPEEALHLWQDLATELHCLDAPYDFANGQARFLFLRQAGGNLHYIPHEDYRCAVTMMCGLPGAGKDTWLAKYRPTLPVVALDAIREDLDVDATDNQGHVIQEARERCRQHLRAGADFAFNATNVTTSVRKKWIDLFADYGARIEIVHIEPTLTTVLRQNAKRPDPVPSSVIHKLAAKMEVPDITECHGITFVEGS